MLKKESFEFFPAVKVSDLSGILEIIFSKHLIYKVGNQGTESIRDLNKITQLIKDRTRTKNQASDS